MTAISVKERTALGRKVKSLRTEGILPGVVYGPKRKTSLPIAMEISKFMTLWKEAGETTMIDLSIGDEKPRKALIHAVELDPVKHTPIHVDFYELDTEKPLVLAIPLRFTGEAPAEKALGGTVLKQLHEIEIEALPANLPHDIEVSLDGLKTFDDRITVGDIALPEGVVATAEPDVIVAIAEAPRTQEEIDAEEESSTGGGIDFDKIEDADKKGKADEDDSADESTEKTEE